METKYSAMTSSKYSGNVIVNKELYTKRKYYLEWKKSKENKDRVCYSQALVVKELLHKVILLVRNKVNLENSNRTHIALLNKLASAEINISSRNCRKTKYK